MKIKNITAFAFCSSLLTTAFAQAPATSFKFDFGPGKAAPGYTQVLATTLYSKTSGYGFDFNTAPTGTDRGGKDELKGDFVSSDKPFYFSVNVPEGNYKVTVTLGDSKNATETTIKAESRRLMVLDAKTEAGKFITKTFIVHRKDRNIDATTQVRLKPRELTKLDWDERLTLEFDGKTAVDAVELTKVNDLVTVYLAGNSTVVNQDFEPWGSWGQMIPLWFKPGVAIANMAESGYALNSFVGDKRLQKIMSEIKPGDYLFVEFGHNDEKETGPNAGAYKSYTDRLKQFVTETKAKGATLIIVTPTARRSFQPDGKMNNTHGDYPDAARKVAAETGTPLIDLTAMSTTLAEALGEEGTKKEYEMNPETQKNDNTHFSPFGAFELSKIIVNGIKANKLGLAKFLVDDFPAFNPAKPDAPESFHWPESPMKSLEKPEGN